MEKYNFFVVSSLLASGLSKRTKYVNMVWEKATREPTTYGMSSCDYRDKLSVCEVQRSLFRITFLVHCPVH